MCSYIREVCDKEGLETIGYIFVIIVLPVGPELQAEDTTMNQSMLLQRITTQVSIQLQSSTNARCAM